MQDDETPASYHWKKDPATGEDVPPPIVLEYLKNLVSLDDDRLSDTEWADVHGVSRRTLLRWRNDDRFRRLWREASDNSVLGPDAIHPIYRAAIKIASDENHPQWAQAAKLVLTLTEKVRPPTLRVEVSPTEKFEQMSDEQLAHWLAANGNVGELEASTGIEDAVVVG